MKKIIATKNNFKDLIEIEQFIEKMSKERKISLETYNEVIQEALAFVASYTRFEPSGDGFFLLKDGVLSYIDQETNIGQNNGRTIHTH